MGAVNALLDGFGAGYETTGRVMRNSELAKIAKATPTASDGGFSFLGKTYGAMPDDTTISRGRQLAMAGVFDKFGEVERASEMRQTVRRDEIADLGLAMNKQRFEWEKQNQAAAALERDRAQAMNAELQQVFMNSPIGRRSQAFADASRRFEQERAAYESAVASGVRDAVPPSPPAAAPPSVGEALLLNAEALSVQARHGMANPEAFMRLAEMGKKLSEEGYGNALTLAQNGAPLTQVVEAFNATGQTKIDPKTIIGDKTVDRGGVKSRLLTFKAPDGSTQTIDTLAELDAIGKADKVFTRAYAANADARGAAAAGRAAEDHAAGAPQRQLGRRMAELGLAATDPNATPAQREAARALLAEGKGADKDAPAQVKLAEAIVRSGLRPDMKSALEFAMTAKDKSPEALKADLYKAALTANFGDAKRARETTEEAMRYLSADAASSAGGGGMPEPKTPEEHAKLPAGTRYRAPDGSIRVK